MSALMPIERSTWWGCGHRAAHQARSGIEVPAKAVAVAAVSSGLACDEGIAKDVEPARVRLAFGAGEGIDRRPDANVHEATILEQFLPGCTRQTTGNSSRPKLDVCRRGRGHRLAVGNIGELQLAARPQHTRNFAEHLPLVGA
jgi:hypothetical protein